MNYNIFSEGGDGGSSDDDDDDDNNADNDNDDGEFSLLTILLGKHILHNIDLRDMN